MSSWTSILKGQKKIHLTRWSQTLEQRKSKNSDINSSRKHPSDSSILASYPKSSKTPKFSLNKLHSRISSAQTYSFFSFFSYFCSFYTIRDSLFPVLFSFGKGITKEQKFNFLCFPQKIRKRRTEHEYLDVNGSQGFMVLSWLWQTDNGMNIGGLVKVWTCLTKRTRDF